MRYRTLGRTGLVVSEIGLGSWELGGAYFLRDRSSAGSDPAGYTDVAEQVTHITRPEYIMHHAVIFMHVKGASLARDNTGCVLATVL